MSEINPLNFRTVVLGTVYYLPIYSVQEGAGLVDTGNTFPLSFVRGSKIGSEQVEKHDGILHEALLAMQITDLEYKNTLVPSEETEEVITHLKYALAKMELRAAKRKAAGVQGTYKKL